MHRRRLVVLLLAAAALAGAAQPARAHPLGQRPVLFLARTASGVATTWVVAPDDARALAEHLGLGPIRLDTMHEHEAFRRYVRARFTIEVSGERCAAAVEPVRQVPTGFAVPATFTCDTEPDVLGVRVTMLHDIDDRYQTIYEARAGDRTARGVLTATSPSARITLTPAVVTADPSPEPTTTEAHGLLARITATLQAEAGAAPFLVALLLALLLGAGHAVTPGHGKTLTAAYLIGVGGTARQGAMLGGIVAVTHAVGTAALGAAALAANRLLLPGEVGPWLDIAAGVLILGLAVVIARARPHEHADAAPPTTRRLAVVGLVGGLIPSPDAIAIVLVAFTLDRWTAGAALIAAFSLGLAAVVVGVAVAATRAGAFVRRTAGARFFRYAPAVTAAIFVALGAIVLANGIRRL